MDKNEAIHMCNIKLLSINSSLNLHEKILFIEWIELGASWDYPE